MHNPETAPEVLQARTSRLVFYLQAHSLSLGFCLILPGLIDRPGKNFHSLV